MSRLPQVTPRKLLSALQRAGFVIQRVKGSHYFLQHAADASRRTVVALHSGDIPQGTLRDILKQTKLSREELLKLF
jgi:predicted RNA binding protein YcfA (HicA-like mRNA interferase family)